MIYICPRRGYISLDSHPPLIHLQPRPAGTGADGADCTNNRTRVVLTHVGLMVRVAQRDGCCPRDRAGRARVAVPGVVMAICAFAGMSMIELSLVLSECRAAQAHEVVWRDPGLQQSRKGLQVD